MTDGYQEYYKRLPAYENGKKPEWMKPVKSKVSHWEQFTHDAGKVLSGLNKTVGTALTGASLATTGLWNAARIMDIGKGTAWRLAAAKDALTGAKAGMVADVGNFLEEPTLTNAAQVGLSKVGSKDLTTQSNKITNLISTGFDFDDLTKVPAYEEGGKKLPANVKTLPQFTPGTPEYAKYQNQISGRAESVQPEAYLTPAGYVKDAVNFVEDISNGDYGGAAVDAVLNVIPWGVGKTLKGIKKKISKVNGATGDISLDSRAEPFQQTITKRKGKKSNKPSPEVEDAYFNNLLNKSQVASKYEKEISNTIDNAIFPDDETLKLINEVDAGYGTNYKKAYSTIAMRDMTNRGKYVKFKDLDPGTYGTLHKNEIPGDTYSINDFQVFLDPNYYMPGTANHELGHLADGLVNPEVINGSFTNKYLEYLLDADNTLSTNELMKRGLYETAKNKSYLSRPTEAKSHMLSLKRGLLDSGKIKSWSNTVDKNMVEDYLFNTKGPAADRINSMVRNQYNLYRDKQGFINRLNKLIPMEIAAPLGLFGMSYQLSED